MTVQREVTSDGEISGQTKRGFLLRGTQYVDGCMLNFCGSIKEVGYDTGDRVEMWDGPFWVSRPYGTDFGCGL